MPCASTLNNTTENTLEPENPMAEYAAKRNPNRCPTHPGEFLRDDILPAISMSKSDVAAALGISRQHLYDVLGGKKPVSPEVAVRLGKAFGDGPDVWLRMQAAYDAWHARRSVDVSKVKVLTAA
jgi:addiction module HigA family antidote